jgi:predicted Zn finger-like uncharacterized protein
MAIAFSCQHCGKQYRVNDDLAGKKIKCSKCGQSARVPGVKKRAAESGDPKRMFGFEATAREAREEGFERAFPEGRPTGSGFTFFRLLGVPVVLAIILVPLVALALLAYEVPAAVTVAEKLHVPPRLVKQWVMPDPGIAEDARYFPSDCKAVAIVNIQNIVDSEAYRSAEAEANKEGQPVAEWKALGAGLSLEDIQSVTAGAGAAPPAGEGETAAPPRPAVVVLRFKKPVSADDIQAAPLLLSAVQVLSALIDGRDPSDVAKVDELKFEQSTAGGYTTYESDALSFCTIGDRAFAFGSRGVLRAILARRDHDRLSDTLQEGLVKADAAEASFVLVAEAGAIPENLARKIPSEYTEKVRALAVSLHLNHEVALRSTLFCTDKDTAAALAKQADQTLGAINTVIAAGLESKNPLNPQSVASGKRVSVSVTTDVDKILQGKAVVSRILGRTEKKD